MADLRVLHVVPRWNAGGANPGLVLEAEIARTSGSRVSHRVLALEPGADPGMLRAALSAGLRVQFDLPGEAEAQLVEAVDVVVLHWWNTPSVRRWIDRFRGRDLRWVLSAHVNGRHRPQRLPPGLCRSASQVVVDCPVGMAAALDVVDDENAVHLVPSLARLDVREGSLDERTDRSIVHLGTLNVFKLSPAFVRLHESAARRGATIVVGGSGGDEDRFRAEADELGIGAAFRWSGFVRDVPAFYADASVLSSPMSALSYASSDRTVQEAQAAGVPVLLPRDSPVAHLVREGETGFFADDDEQFGRLVAEIAEGSLRLPSRRSVREAALEHHDPAPRATALAAVYASAAGSAPRPVDDGFDDLTQWMSFQVGDVDELVDARRPTLAALCDVDLLGRHQRWACEGGYAQYRNAFGAALDS